MSERKTGVGAALLSVLTKLRAIPFKYWLLAGILVLPMVARIGSKAPRRQATKSINPANLTAERMQKKPVTPGASTELTAIAGDQPHVVFESETMAASSDSAFLTVADPMASNATFVSNGATADEGGAPEASVDAKRVQLEQIFALEKPGVYQLWARMRADNIMSDAIYLGMNGDLRRIHPPETGRYQWVKVGQATLKEGSHRIQVGHAESAVRLDALALVGEDPPVPLAMFELRKLLGDRSFSYFESEHFQTYDYSTFEDQADVNASAGSYIVSNPVQSSGAKSPPSDRAEASQYFEVLAPGKYELWVRLRGSGNAADIIHVGFDGNMEEIAPSAGISYSWIRAKANLLSAGVHSLDIRPGDAPVRLDSLVVVNAMAVEEPAQALAQQEMPTPPTVYAPEVVDVPPAAEPRPRKIAKPMKRKVARAIPPATPKEVAGSAAMPSGKGMLCGGQPSARLPQLLKKFDALSVSFAKTCPKNLSAMIPAARGVDGLIAAFEGTGNKTYLHQAVRISMCFLSARGKCKSTGKAGACPMGFPRGSVPALTVDDVAQALASTGTLLEILVRQKLHQNKTNIMAGVLRTAVWNMRGKDASLVQAGWISQAALGLYAKSGQKKYLQYIQMQAKNLMQAIHDEGGTPHISHGEAMAGFLTRLHEHGTLISRPQMVRYADEFDAYVSADKNKSAIARHPSANFKKNRKKQLPPLQVGGFVSWARYNQELREDLFKQITRPDPKGFARMTPSVKVGMTGHLVKAMADPCK